MGRRRHLRQRPAASLQPPARSGERTLLSPGCTRGPQLCPSVAVSRSGAGPRCGSPSGLLQHYLVIPTAFSGLQTAPALLRRLESREVPLKNLPVGMPHISMAAALQLCVLLSALPAQYYISQWYGTDPAQRIQLTKRSIIACGSSFMKSYLSLDAWAARLKLWLAKTRNWYYGEKKIKSAENEAETRSYFAESTHVRSPKPESIQFSVGQVIIHRRFGYSGVIVGWDVTAKAPEEWLQHKYPPAKQDAKDTPHYRILINNTSGFGKSTTYVPEEEITVIVGLEVHHPDMNAYFSGYDGSKYVMQPWLKKIYPHD